MSIQFNPAIYDLAGRVVIITGAGSGIGSAAASLLAAHGAQALAVDINDSVHASAAAIRDAGYRASSFMVDIADRSAVGELFSKVLTDFGRIDGLITSAGIMLDGSVADLEEADLDRVLAVNLKGTVWCCRAAAAIMMRQRSGSIVTMSSAVADIPAPNTAAYAMSKGAVVQFTRVLALEVASAGVRVNSVAPGIIETAITERHYRSADGTIDEAKRQVVLDRLGRVAPLRRVGSPQDVAHLMHYLICDASSFMTGQVLRLNGGAVML